MRSLILLCALVLGLVSPVLCLAQQGPWLFQLKAGPQFVKLSDPLGTSNGPFTGRGVGGVGYLLGGAVEHMTDGVFGWRAELLCSVRNTGYDFDEQWSMYEGYDTGDALERGRRNSRTVGVELPLLITFRKWTGLRIDAGPAVSYVAHARQHTTGDRVVGGVPEPYEETTDITQQVKRWEAAVVAGAEVESGDHLSMGVRYWGGLTSLDKAPGTSPSYTRMWQITLGWVLGKGRLIAGPAGTYP